MESGSMRSAVELVTLSPFPGLLPGPLFLMLRFLTSGALFPIFFSRWWMYMWTNSSTRYIMKKPQHVSRGARENSNSRSNSQPGNRKLQLLKYCYTYKKCLINSRKIFFYYFRLAIILSW